MNYLIQINGEVKGPFPIEKLIEKGVTKRTRVCIDGAEEWFFAEDVRALDTIWEAKKVVPLKVIEIKKEEIQTIEEKVKVEEPSKDGNIGKEEDLSGKAIKRMLLMGGVIIILFFGINWALKNWKTRPPARSSPSEGNTSEVDTIKSIEKDKPLVKLINPQKEYDNLIKEGIIEYEIDSFQKAFKKFKLAQIVRNDNNLLVSEKAESIYKKAIQKGNVSFGNGQLEALIPLAEIHYKIAQAIDPTPEVEAKIKRCQSTQ